MAKFTPGPWKIDDRGNILILSEYSNFICDCTSQSYEFDVSPEQEEANARLIVAAPEMYEIIKEFMSYGNIFRVKIGEETSYLKAQKLLKKIDGGNDGR